MLVDPLELMRHLVRDGVPDPVPGPDGRLGPPVPLGKRVALPERGTTFVREVAGPPGAPTVVLLHGWMASGGLNWFRAFGPLGTEFRVLAPDLRGHGRGVRSRGRFRLEDCADDLALLLTTLGVGPAVVVGYSMGGSIAQLLWRRHPEMVAGLVLCATAPRLELGPVDGRPVDVALGALAGAARVGGWLAHVPSAPVRALRAARASRPASFVEWALAELRRHDLRMLMEAARAAGDHDSRPWLHEIDVPTAVVVTTRDRAIAPRAQLEAAAIRGATVYELDGGHAVCTRERFTPPLLDACLAVAAAAS